MVGLLVNRKRRVERLGDRDLSVKSRGAGGGSGSGPVGCANISGMPAGRGDLLPLGPQNRSAACLVGGIDDGNDGRA